MPVSRSSLSTWILLVSQRLGWLLLFVVIFSFAAPRPALAAAFVVTKTADTNDGVCDSDCSLREAIVAANAAASNDTITFSVSETVALGSTIDVNNNGSLIIDGGGTVTIGKSSPGGMALLNIENNTTFTLQNITIAGGTGSRGLFVRRGTNVTVKNSTFSGNTFSAILNDGGTLTVINSTFVGNSSTLSLKGAAIQNDTRSTLTVINSTFSGNNATSGGAIYNNGPQTTATIINSTFSGSTSTTGGIFNSASGTLTIRNSIIANAVSGGDCANEGTIVVVNSLIEDGSCGITNGVNGNKTGDPALNGDLTIPAASPALNAGSNALLPADTTDLDNDSDTAEALPLDKAGNARVSGGTVDMGAFEFVLPDFVVDTLSDADLQGCSAAANDCSLRGAVTRANALPTNDTITFSLNGTITLTSALPNLTNSGTLTITGNGRANTIISGNDAVQVFYITDGATVTLNGLTIRDGSGGFGGGVNNENGTLTVTNSLFSDNNATAFGGGIVSGGGTMLTVTNSAFTGNTAGSGGGLLSFGTTLVTNSTFVGNSAGNGGGVYASGGTLTVANSTLSGNTATVAGGSLFAEGTITLHNTIVANASGGECAFFEDGIINAVNSLIEGGLACVNGTNSNNLTGDPALNSDLSLPYQSIAINAGNNALVPAGVTTDFAGNPRIQGGTVDMGAYESNATGALTVQLAMQGRPAAPNAAWIVSAQVQIRPQGGGSPILSGTYASNSSGQLTIPALPEGTYILWIKGTHTLARTQSVTIAAGSNSATTPTLPEGDADNNNVVNISDFSILAAAFGKAEGQVGFDARADFNEDNVINIADFSLLASSFGQAGAG